MLSSAQNVIVAYMNSQQLLLPTQDQATQNFSIKWGQAPKDSPLPEVLLAV